jgi:inhibitor of cysteine peptidase
MKKRSIFLTAVTMIAALGLAAADSKDLGPNLPNPDEPVEIRVTDGDANKEVKAKVGEFVVIEIEGNATTGYTWSEMPGRSDSVLEFQGQEYKTRDYPIGMVGVGGKAFFRYLVKNPGRTEIVLGYSRPWEKDTPPAQMFNVKIVAEAADAKAAQTDDKSAKAGAAPAPKTVEMTRDDSGKTVTVRPGDTVQIKLKSNRTTGYSWALAGKLDEKVLKSEGNEYKVDEHPAGMVGVGGNDVWTFKALAAGRTEIVLGYARPWEKDKEPAQAFKLSVVVEGAAPAAEAKTAATAASKDVRLNAGDNGKTVQVAVGGTVTLTLESNPTTGFSWTRVEDVDKSILKLEKNDYKQNANPGGMVGVGGRTTIVYRALKSGKAKIDLTYMQPWEPDSEFNTKYTVTVEVLP